MIKHLGKIPLKEEKFILTHGMREFSQSMLTKSHTTGPGMRRNMSESTTSSCVPGSKDQDQSQNKPIKDLHD